MLRQVYGDILKREIHNKGALRIKLNFPGWIFLRKKLTAKKAVNYLRKKLHLRSLTSIHFNIYLYLLPAVHH